MVVPNAAVVAVVPPMLFQSRVTWLTWAVPTAGTVALRPSDAISGNDALIGGSNAKACGNSVSFLAIEQATWMPLRTMVRWRVTPAGLFGFAAGVAILAAVLFLARRLRHRRQVVRA